MNKIDIKKLIKEAKKKEDYELRESVIKTLGFNPEDKYNGSDLNKDFDRKILEANYIFSRVSEELHKRGIPDGHPDRVYINIATTSWYAERIGLRSIIGGNDLKKWVVWSVIIKHPEFWGLGLRSLFDPIKEEFYGVMGVIRYFFSKLK